MAEFRRVCLIGVDRAAGSFALGMKRAGFSGPIAAVANKPTLAACFRLGIVSGGSSDPAEALPGADLIVLTTAGVAGSGVLESVLGAADENALLVDMTRDKAATLKAVTESGRKDLRYAGLRVLGGGNDTNNYAKSDGLWMAKKTAILTPRGETDGDAAAALSELLGAMGTNAVTMDGPASERLCAQAQLVPKAAALAMLAGLFESEEKASLAGALLGGWLAEEARETFEARKLEWIGELQSGGEAVRQGIDRLIEQLNTVKKHLAEGTLADEVNALIERAAQAVQTEAEEAGYPIALTAGTDPRSLERIAQLMAGARIKLGELTRIENAAAGTYRLLLGSRDECKQAVKLLNRAGIQATEL